MSKDVKYKKSRMMSQARMGNLMSKALKVDTIITIQDVMEDHFIDDNDVKQPNDKIVCMVNDEQFKLTVREYNKMKTVGNEPLFESEGDGDEILLPNAFKIVSAEGRIDAEERKRFPTYAYKLAPEFVKKDSKMTYEQLIAGGIKDEHPFDQLQNYTIEFV
jgi:hypothetical protein